MSSTPVALEFNQPSAGGKGFQKEEILGIGTAGEKLDSVRFSAQKEQGMNAIELLVYAVIGVIGTLGLAAVIGYKVADHLDKKHHTD